MKKLLALLLALMLLPVAALAQSRVTTLYLTLDGERIKAYCDSIRPEDGTTAIDTAAIIPDESTVELLCGLEKAIGKLQLQLAVDDSAICLTLLYGGDMAADVTAVYADGGLKIASSFWEDFYLDFSPEEMNALGSELAVDWAGALGRIAAKTAAKAGDAWKPVKQTGDFSSEVYSGGTYALCWQFVDGQIVTWVDAALSALEEEADVMALLKALLDDEQVGGMIAALHQYNQLAETLFDDCLWDIRAIFDENDALIGPTVFVDGGQPAYVQLNLGFQNGLHGAVCIENDHRTIAGKASFVPADGLHADYSGELYYYPDDIVAIDEVIRRGEQLIGLTGTLAGVDEGNVENSFTLTKALGGSMAVIRGEESVVTAGDSVTYRMAHYLGDDDTPAAVLTAETQPGEAISIDEANLRPLSLLTAGQEELEQYAEKTNQGIIMLATMLTKDIPFTTLMKLIY
ncbi:MAG: hypothetical protein Q4C54_00155 [Clostridia bacterium]|nr:hypothetical protein [Clostridia bacterium]